MSQLKFSDIVERCRLKSSTVQYVLKNAEEALNLPEAGSQGIHRQFEIDEAFRLAYCTTLVNCGIRLEDSIRLVKYTTANAMAKSRHGHTIGSPFFPHLQWRLWIFELNWIQMKDRHGNTVPSTGWYSISEGKTTPAFASPYFVVEIQLSQLQSLLSN